MKIAKSLLRKAKAANSDPYLRMLAFRNTPTKEMSSSPVQRLRNRRTRTLLPISEKLLKQEVQKGMGGRLRSSKSRQVYYYNRGVKDLLPPRVGDTGRVRPTSDRRQTWQKAVVTGQASQPRSYEVMTEEGARYRRNRRHLRKMGETARQTEADVGISEVSPQARQNNNMADRQGASRGQQPVTTRSGREVRQPKYLMDYVKE